MKQRNVSNRGHRRNTRDSQSSSKLEKDEIPKQLPMVQDQLAVAMRLRFVTTQTFGGSFSVTYQNLLDAWFFAASATVAYELFDFVRIKKVTIRAMAVGTQTAGGLNYGPSATVAVEFPGLTSGQLAGGKQKSNTALGYDTPAYVSIKPDPQSQTAQFQPNNGVSAFFVRAFDQAEVPISGAIIDVDVVYRNSADVAPAVIASPRGAMTPGQLYFGGLDGLPEATTRARSVFIPRA